MPSGSKVKPPYRIGAWLIVSRVQPAADAVGCGVKPDGGKASLSGPCQTQGSVFHHTYDGKASRYGRQRVTTRYMTARNLATSGRVTMRSLSCTTAEALQRHEMSRTRQAARLLTRCFRASSRVPARECAHDASRPSSSLLPRHWRWSHRCDLTL